MTFSTLYKTRALVRCVAIRFQRRELTKVAGNLPGTTGTSAAGEAIARRHKASMAINAIVCEGRM